MQLPARGIGVALCAIVLLGVAAELVCRASLSEDTRDKVERLRFFLQTGNMREFEARAYTVFQRPRTGYWSNSDGFNDPEWTRAREEGVPRILCLGSSTTEGGNSAGRRGTYPFQLEDVLQRRTGRDFEVMNAGISGWTTAEILVSWFLTLKDFQPDVVVLHEGANDLWPRFKANFRSDYSHWRKPVQIRLPSGPEGWLVNWSCLYLVLRLRRQTVPEILDVCTNWGGPPEPLLEQGKLPYETSLAFRRNVLTITHSAQEAGCTVVLMTMPRSPAANVAEYWRYGIRENNQQLRELARENGFLLADAEAAFEASPALAAQFTDMVHLEPPGNLAKAELVADALADWVAGLPRETAREPKLLLNQK